MRILGWGDEVSVCRASTWRTIFTRLGIGFLHVDKGQCRQFLLHLVVLLLHLLALLRESRHWLRCGRWGVLNTANFDPLVTLFLLDHIVIGNDLIPLEELWLLLDEWWVSGQCFFVLYLQFMLPLHVLKLFVWGKLSWYSLLGLHISDLAPFLQWWEVCYSLCRWQRLINKVAAIFVSSLFAELVLKLLLSSICCTGAHLKRLVIDFRCGPVGKHRRLIIHDFFVCCITVVTVDASVRSWGLTLRCL